jgi:hypothetical protein
MRILLITDQFAADLHHVEPATDAWSQLDDPYERACYGGIICARKAKALLRLSTLGSTRAAVAALQEAIACYGRAELLRPAGNEDVILR